MQECLMQIPLNVNLTDKQQDHYHILKEGDDTEICMFAKNAPHNKIIVHILNKTRCLARLN
jgi:hypothetical protein